MRSPRLRPLEGLRPRPPGAQAGWSQKNRQTEQILWQKRPLRSLPQNKGPCSRDPSALRSDCVQTRYCDLPSGTGQALSADCRASLYWE